MDQITTYATLKTAIAGMLHRASDTTITGNTGLAIQMCESELYRRLILKDMESDEPLTLTTGQNYVALPTGYVSPIAFWLVESNIRFPLEQVLPTELPYLTSNSQPAYWAIDGANIRFDCPASENYSAYLRCLKRSNLSDSVTSNALLLAHPDVYLFGGLKYIAMLTKNDKELSKNAQLFEEAIKQISALENRNRASVPLRTDIPGGFYENFLG